MRQASSLPSTRHVRHVHEHLGCFTVVGTRTPSCPTPPQTCPTTALLRREVLERRLHQSRARLDRLVGVLLQHLQVDSTIERSRHLDALATPSRAAAAPCCARRRLFAASTLSPTMMASDTSRCCLCAPSIAVCRCRRNDHEHDHDHFSPRSAHLTGFHGPRTSETAQVRGPDSLLRRRTFFRVALSRPGLCGTSP